MDDAHDAETERDGSTPAGEGAPPGVARRRQQLARRRVRGSMRHAGIEGWGRTAFVISLCVLVWVLPFFRASGECCGGSHSIEPPSAQHGRDLGMAVTLQIDRSGEAWLDGRRVSRDASGREELARALATLRSHWGVLNPGVAHDGSILVLADRRTRWGDIRPLVMVAAREGHPHLQLAVNAPDEGDDRLWEHFR